MASAEKTIQVYQELAAWHGREGDATQRDRFLLLTADALLAAGQKEKAEQVRAKLLQLNPHHLLKPFPSLTEALKSADVRSYLDGLRRNYPPDKAAQTLAALRDGKPDGEKSASTPAAAAEVYQMRDEAAARNQAAHSVPPPAAPNRLREANARPAPVAANSAAPYPWRAPRDSGARERLLDADPPETPAGAWLALVLFWLLLLGAAALLLYTFGRPFLPL